MVPILTLRGCEVHSTQNEGMIRDVILVIEVIVKATLIYAQLLLGKGPYYYTSSFPLMLLYIRICAYAQLRYRRVPCS